MKRLRAACRRFVRARIHPAKPRLILLQGESAGARLIRKETPETVAVLRGFPNEFPDSFRNLSRFRPSGAALSYRVG